MAVEDGAVLGSLLGAMAQVAASSSFPRHVDPVAAALALYEEGRKSRTTLNVQGALANRDFYHMVDGPEQAHRDSLIKDWDWDAGRPSVYKWVDKKYQTDLLGHNVIDATRSAFEAWYEAVKLVGPDVERATLPNGSVSFDSVI